MGYRENQTNVERVRSRSGENLTESCFMIRKHLVTIESWNMNEKEKD